MQRINGITFIVWLFLDICFVINVTADCETCFLRKCKENKCTDGCASGYFDEDCTHICPPACRNGRCTVNHDTGQTFCTDGCTENHCGSRCKISCIDVDVNSMCDRYTCETPVCNGQNFGKSCQHTCSCSGFICDNNGTCHNTSCVDGRYGGDCKKTCHEGCKQCHRTSGKCLEEETQKEDSNHQSTVFVVVTTALALLVMSVIIALVLIWRKKTSSRHKNIMTQRENMAIEMSELIEKKRTCEIDQVLTGQDSLILEKMEELKQTMMTVEKDIQHYKEQNKALQQENKGTAVVAMLQDKTCPILCIKVEYDRHLCNTAKTRINEDEKLINERDPNPTNDNTALKNYWGTCSTFPLSWSQSPQYLEVTANVDIGKVMTGSDLLLEIGLARREDMDLSHSLTKSYRLNVAHCPEHASICRSVWKHGFKLNCLQDTFENNTNSSTKLQYGILFDYILHRIAFLDILQDQVIGVINGVDNSVLLWPTFGVYYPDRGTVRMSLLGGSEINLSEEKKELILSCLSERHKHIF